MINSTAIFAASDIVSTINYYKEVLGFESSWTWGDPPSFGSASLGGVTLMFNLNPDLASKIQGHQHWIRVDDTDELYARHLESGAKIVSEIEDKHWGQREYVVEDINGYFLRFAGPLATAVKPSEPFPDDVQLELRVPTIKEYVKVAGGAFGYREADARLLETTWCGVVALSPSGEAIGVLRVMRDAPGWFSIWDVAVLPDWQAHRIGSNMMRTALGKIRAEHPGAIVHLFAYKHGFYERLGFGKDTVTMIRL